MTARISDPRSAAQPRPRSLGSDESYFRYRGWIPIPLYAVIVPLLDLRTPATWEIVFALGTTFCGLLMRAAARLEMGRSSDTRRLHAHRLHTSGPYAWTRNPIYLGNILMALGASLLAGAYAYAPLLGVLLTLHYLRVIRAEERMLSRTFGEPYRDYCASVPRLLPRFPRSSLTPRLRPLRREARILVVATLLALTILGIRTIPVVSDAGAQPVAEHSP